MNTERIRMRFCRSNRRTPRREFEHGVTIAEELITEMIQARKRSFETLLATTETNSPMAMMYTGFLSMLDDMVRDIERYANDWPEVKDEEPNDNAAA